MWMEGGGSEGSSRDLQEHLGVTASLDEGNLGYMGVGGRGRGAGMLDIPFCQCENDSTLVPIPKTWVAEFQRFQVGNLTNI